MECVSRSGVGMQLSRHTLPDAETSMTSTADQAEEWPNWSVGKRNNSEAAGAVRRTGVYRVAGDAGEQGEQREAGESKGRIWQSLRSCNNDGISHHHCNLATMAGLVIIALLQAEL